MSPKTLAQISKQIKSLYAYNEIILGVNHKCNLNCRFCYLNYDNSLKTEEMTLPQYKKLFIEAKTLGIDTYKIAEKEPFCTPTKTFKIINLIRKIYGKSKVHISLVTNGLLAQENLSNAIRYKISLNQMMFSIDGFHSTQKHLRRISTKEKDITKKILQTAENYLNSKITKKISFNSVLTNQNYKEIPKLIKHINNFNSKFNTFSIDIFNENPDKNNGYLKTSKIQFLKFMKQITNLTKQKNIDIHLTILGNKQMKPYVAWLKENNYLKGKSKIDTNLFYLNDSRVPLKIYYQLFPTEYIRLIRVSSDGFIMGIGKEIMKGDYKKHAIGNIKNNSLKDLWNSVRKKSVQLMINEYFSD